MRMTIVMMAVIMPRASLRRSRPVLSRVPPQGVDLDAESVLVFLQQWRSLFRVKPKPTRGSIDVWVTRQVQG